MKYAALLVLAIFALGCTAQSNADVTVNTPGVAIDMDVGGAPSGEVREFDVVARTWTWEPSTITVKEGDTVIVHSERDIDERSRLKIVPALVSSGS